MADPIGDVAAIRMERADGTEVLSGAASIGADTESDLDRRLAEARTPVERIFRPGETAPVATMHNTASLIEGFAGRDVG